MSIANSIDMIFKTACKKMTAAEANAYVGMTVTFVLNQLTEKENFSIRQFELLLEEEARFHQRCK